MGFISAKCPHCGKELQLPQDAEKVVCMYCARPIDVKELLDSTAKACGENYERLMKEAESLLTEELLSFRVQMKNMKQNKYPADFEKYQGLINPALKTYSLAATECDDAADHFAGFFLDRLLEQYQKEGIKKEKDYRFFDCRYTIVAYTIPSILEMKTPSAEALADKFLEKWNAHYPKSPLGKSTFEAINKGFRRRLCFITTAVCSSLGKGDDCAELNCLRRFRDEWFARTPQGQAKINEYYLFAPMIVSAIDNSGRGDGIYRDIWESYLVPCLQEIDSGNPEQCAEKYEKMILELERKWLN